MKLIVWLGNPWAQYSNTRHNAWFFVIENFVKNNKLWELEYDNKYKWEILKSEYDWEKVIFCKPQTFMNKSWDSVWPLANFYKILPQDILVIHDEIDLPTAKIQSKFGWSSAWHNWLKSIIAMLWTNDFRRIRIWIDRPANQDFVADYVLTNFKKEEIQSIENKIDEIEKLISDFIKE